MPMPSCAKLSARQTGKKGKRYAVTSYSATAPPFSRLMDCLPALKAAPGPLASQVQTPALEAPDWTVWDSNKLSIEAPKPTPSPLRESYEAVAEAVYKAWEARFLPSFRSSPLVFQDAVGASFDSIASRSGPFGS